MVKLQVCQMHTIRFLGGVLAPPSHCSILIEPRLPVKPSRKMIRASNGFD